MLQRKVANSHISFGVFSELNRQPRDNSDRHRHPLLELADMLHAAWNVRLHTAWIVRLLPRSDGLERCGRLGQPSASFGRADNITCTLVMLLAGCETKPPAPPATSEDREQALSALNACLQAAARKLDDGKSEASTVVLALRPSCAAEFARSRDLYARSLSSQASQLYHKMDDQTFKHAATNAVLE